MNMVLPQPSVISSIVSVLIPSGDTESISEISTRYLAAGTAGLVEMMGIDSVSPDGMRTETMEEITDG